MVHTEEKDDSRSRTSSIGSQKSGTSNRSRSDSVDEILKKRKRTVGTAEHATQSEYRKVECTEAHLLEEALGDIIKLTKDLSSRIEQNTRREIKDITARLNRRIQCIDKDHIRTWIKNRKWETETMTYDVEVQTERPKLNAALNTKEAGTQTPELNGNSWETLVMNLPKEINKDNFKEIINHPWDHDLFKTDLRVGVLTSTKDNVLKVLLTEAGKKNAIEYQIPELTEVKENYGLLEKSHRIKVNGQWRKIETKWIKAEFPSESEDEAFEILNKVRADADFEETIAFNTPAGISTTKFRKMVECVFQQSAKPPEIIIYKDKDKDKDNDPKIRNSYAFVVENKSGKYNETLREVKQALQTGGIDDGIKTIRSTKDGKILLTLDRSEVVATKVQQVLDTMNTNKDIKSWQISGQKKEAIHIRGLDALSTEREVKTAIEDRLGADINVKIGNLRPMTNNTQAVTITLPKDAAEQIIKDKWLKIGLVSCRVERRIQLGRCSKCWAYDHKTSECSGPDRTKLCYKCGRDGHQAKECQNEMFCAICSEQGHSAGSGRCTVFKRMLSIARREENKASTTGKSQVKQP